MVLYGIEGFFLGGRGQSQTVDPTCTVCFRNYFRKQCPVNASNTCLEGKDVYLIIKGHRSSGRWKREASKGTACPEPPAAAATTRAAGKG